MKITVKLILALVFVTTLVVSIFAYLQMESERDRLRNELDIRASILAESLQESVQELLHLKSPVKLQRLVNRFGTKDRLSGVVVFDSLGKQLESVNTNITTLPDSITHILESINQSEGRFDIVKLGGKTMHIYSTPLFLDNKAIGALLILHDASYIDTRIQNIWRNNFFRLLVQTLMIILTTVIVFRFTIAGPITQVVKWMKNIRTGKTNLQMSLPRGDILKPLADEAALLAKSLSIARSKAEEEARLRLQTESIWTSERLKEYIRQEINDKNLIVVSNREPYMHIKHGSNIECIVPAGGLVTALDPVLKACGGVWIAQGSGDADQETVDANGKLLVPPEEPAYSLKRVFISKKEEEGYYFGFSNEGIWPLCHITHTRPEFRLEDWIDYQSVNQKFADAVLDEIKDQKEPLVLIQDYHFALLPLLIKSKRPDAHVALFWHIPWPNPEVFGICPWKQEILLGLLGADVIGFHIQFHCNNFLQTSNRFLESKINWEQFTVERRGGTTLVKPFPISIAFKNHSISETEVLQQNDSSREVVYKKIGFKVKYIGVGVDRIDYTKGIVERFRAVERFFEKYPEYIGQFTFVELGAPSRTHIKRYHDLIAEVEEMVDKIKWRFQIKDWQPIIFLKAHHNHEQINLFYKAADLCMVTSLHDGMNLVAKEFVVARNDEDGVLILSQFAGASIELQDALIVNPYNVEEMTNSIYVSLTMATKEKKERMQNMRNLIRERNVYRWAANLITALSRIRIQNKVEENV